MVELAALLFSASLMASILLASGQKDSALIDSPAHLEIPLNLPETRKVPLRRSRSRLLLLNSRFIRKPRKKHLDPEYLHGLLEGHFNKHWMSEDKPTDAKVSSQKAGWAHKVLRDQLMTINLTEELMESGANLSFLQDPSALVSLENWLLKRGSCPARYVWEDIGDLFWPRWIKRAECSNHLGSCSWPPGMNCAPSETLHLRVLRWQCRLAAYRSKDRKRKEWRRLSEGTPFPLKSDFKCQWMVVPYPVTSGCHCTC